MPLYTSVICLLSLPFRRQNLKSKDELLACKPEENSSQGFYMIVLHNDISHCLKNGLISRYRDGKVAPILFIELYHWRSKRA